MTLKSVVGDKYYGVQVLRAVAALAVVAGHSTDYLQVQNGSVPRELSWIHGAAGVDIFFVISGFVMMISSGRLLTKDRPAQIFLWRRILRIVPLYWLLTLVKFALVTVRPSLSAHRPPSTWNVVSSFLFIPSLNGGGDIRPLIPLGWTLNFEMLFYVLFTIALWIASERGERKSLTGLLPFLVPSICLLALLGVARTNRWPVWTALADPIVLEFLMGVGIAWTAMRAKLPGWGAAIALLAIGCSGLIILEPGGSLMLLRPLIWGIPAAMIVLGTVALETHLGHRLPGWLLLLGNASYSIYLIQEFVFPVIHACLERLGKGLVHTRPVETGVAMAVASLLITTPAGVGTYLLVERRMTEFLKKKVGTEWVSPVIR